MPEVIPVQAEIAAPAPEEVVETTPEVTAQAEAGGNLEDLDLNDISPEEAEQFLYHGKALEVPDKPKPEPEATPEVETTPAAEETETEVEAETETAEEADDDKPLPGRISTKQFDDHDQRVLRTMHALNHGKKPGEPGRVGIPEVVAMLAKQDGKVEAPAAAPVEPAPSPVETINEKVTDLESSLKTLREQKRAAIEQGESTVDLEEQIDDTRDALAQERANFAFEQREGERQQAEQAADRNRKANETLASSKAAAIQQFPALKDPSSPLGSMAVDVIQELKDPQHADHALYKSPNAGMLIAQYALNRLAEKEGASLADTVSKYAAKAATPAPKPVPVPPKPATPAPRKVLPAVGSQTTNPPRATPTAQDVFNEVKDDGDGDRAWEAIYGNKPLNLLRP